MTVHPHACGDYWLLASFSFRTSGSSPRVWGLRLRLVAHNQIHPVHPHACGDYPVTYG